HPTILYTLLSPG
nr:Chain B, Nuclear receptor subfamily 0, group B, member 2 [synthetic construct]